MNTAPLLPLIEVSTASFAELFRGHPGGVAIVTAEGPDGRPVGFTATSVISVSADPACLAFSVNRSSSSYAAFREASSAYIHLLGAADQPLAQRFATSGIDRFDGVPWERLVTGEPVLSDVHAGARIELVSSVLVGGSQLFVGQLTHVRTRADEDPLVYCARRYHTLDVS